MRATREEWTLPERREDRSSDPHQQGAGMGRSSLMGDGWEDTGRWESAVTCREGEAVPR